MYYIGFPPGEYNKSFNINAGHKVESVSGDISGNNATLYRHMHHLSLSGLCGIYSWIRDAIDLELYMYMHHVAHSAPENLVHSHAHFWSTTPILINLSHVTREEQDLYYNTRPWSSEFTFSRTLKSKGDKIEMDYTHGAVR